MSLVYNPTVWEWGDVENCRYCAWMLPWFAWSLLLRFLLEAGGPGVEEDLPSCPSHPGNEVASFYLTQTRWETFSHDKQRKPIRCLWPWLAHEKRDGFPSSYKQSFEDIYALRPGIFWKGIIYKWVEQILLILTDLFFAWTERRPGSNLSYTVCQFTPGARCFSSCNFTQPPVYGDGSRRRQQRIEKY